MKVLLNALAAIRQYLQQFFARTVKPLKQFITNLIQSFMKPLQIFPIHQFQLGMPPELEDNILHLLAERVVAVDQHSTEHIVWCGVQRIEILLIFAIQLVYIPCFTCVETGQTLQQFSYFLDLISKFISLSLAVRKVGIGPQRLDGNSPYTQKLMRIHSNDELWRLLAQEQLPQSISNINANDEQLFFAHFDAFVPAKWAKIYLSFRASLNSLIRERTVWWMEKSKCISKS